MDDPNEGASLEAPQRTDPRVYWLLAFQAGNTANFTIALGAPLILTARYLGASEEQVGVLNAIAPLMVALQLLSTNWLERLGYKRVMLMGWSTRAFMLLLITPLPFLKGELAALWLSWGLVIPILLFNIFRGLAAGAWLPWLKVLLPEGARGRFLALEQVTINLSGLATLLLCGAVLGSDPGPLQFSLLYVIAWAGGMASVYFLRKVPEVMPRETADGKGRSLREMIVAGRRALTWKPYRMTLCFTVVHTFALSAVPGFLVMYVNEDLGWTPGNLMRLQACSMVGVLLTAMAWGGLSESHGSRPVLRVALTGQLLLVVFWGASAAGFAVARLETLIIAFMLWGALGAAQSISQTRLTLQSSPARDVTIAMPIHQVAVAFAGGGAPLIWGFLLQRLRQPIMEPGAPHLSLSFLIFFITCAAVGFGAQFLLTRIPEEKAQRTRHMLMAVALDWPVRVLSALPMRARRE